MVFTVSVRAIGWIDVPDDITTTEEAQEWAEEHGGEMSIVEIEKIFDVNEYES
mgnify:CR=1 FL=1